MIAFIHVLLGVDVVYDGVGAATFDVSLKCLKKLGLLVSFGNASGKVPDIDIFKLGPKAIKLTRPSLYEVITTQEEFDQATTFLVQLLQQEKLHLSIHKVYDLEQAALAHQDLEERRTTGKLLLKI